MEFYLSYMTTCLGISPRLIHLRLNRFFLVAEKHCASLCQDFRPNSTRSATRRSKEMVPMHNDLFRFCARRNSSRRRVFLPGLLGLLAVSALVTLAQLAA